MKTLLTGKKYVPSASTDIRKTFARLRREYATAWDDAYIEKLEREKSCPNVRAIRKGTK